MPPSISIDGVEVLAVSDRTFDMHEGGKIEVLARMPVARPRRPVDGVHAGRRPGVHARSSSSPSAAHELTIKKNTVAIVTDGTAVLGLGDIGPEAALPVMEGKALLFKNFAGVDAFPICLDVTDRRRDRRDGRAHRPRVRRHQPRGHRRARRASRSRTASASLLDIPVFHDDQHGTAVVTLAALENALQIVDKQMDDLQRRDRRRRRGRRRHRQDPPRAPG